MKNEIKFIYRHDGITHLVHCDTTELTLTDIQSLFEDFLKGVGYHLPESEL